MDARIVGFVEAALIAVIILLAPVGIALKGGPTGVTPATVATAPTDKSAQLAAASDVDGKRIENQQPGEWLSYGKDYSEQRYSALDQVNRGTVKDLGVAWEFRTGTVRGLESTPIVADGVAFVTGSWSKVWALDAKTGKQLWAYDPQVPGQWGRYACCDVVNRGVAVWKGAVYVGTLDGRLIKLDAKTGKPIWDVNTIDRSRPYTITGAPRIVKGLVLIGNGGAEYGVRGYVTAYDADTGHEAWRFYVVPGNPALPPENAAMAAAMKTWSSGETAHHWWDIGGGGTPWDAMAYDPDLDLVYIGTGNGASWNRNLRSPGGGDNLYLSSIVALRPDTGELVWYYQTTPGEDWDYTATQHLILADLTIDGQQRKVIMQAPKNGIFYVLDRATGKLISAKPYATITWAKGVDMATGRPIENPEARYPNGPTVVFPGPSGAHNWQPMAYSPQTGLVYIPMKDQNFIYAPEKPLSYTPGAWNTGTDFVALGDAVLAAIKAGTPPPPGKGFLRAWNPVTQKQAWSVPMDGPWNGGLLATAGGLVFAGGADGMFSAYDAKTGAKMWSIDLKTGILAPPVTYTVDGEQYLVLAAGWGGADGLAGSPDPHAAVLKWGNNEGRIFAFKLGGKKDVEALPSEKLAQMPEPPAETVDPVLAQKGYVLYHHTCAVCHGFLMEGPGVMPDLRAVPANIWGQYDAIVLDGALADGGMASFKDIVSKDDVTAIRQYVLQQAKAAWDAKHPKK